MTAQKSFLIAVLSLVILTPFVSNGATTIWREKVVLQDRLPSTDGKTTELMFFNRNSGEFSVEIDNRTRQIVSFSGVFRGLTPAPFKILKDRIEALKGNEGIQAVQVDQVTYPFNGKRDLVMRLELNHIGAWLTQGSFDSLMDSARVSFRLNVKKIDSDSIGLSLAIEFEKAGVPREMTLLNWISI